MDQWVLAAGTWAAGSIGAQIVKVGGEFLSRVAGPTADEMGRDFAVTYRQWRQKNALNIAASASKILESRQVEPREIPPSIFWPMLEKASLCDDVTLAELWAQLLANAADVSFTGEVHPTYAAILASLTPVDAKLLNFVFQRWSPFENGRYEPMPFRADVIAHVATEWKRPFVEHALDVFESLGVVTRLTPRLDEHELRKSVELWSSEYAGIQVAGRIKYASPERILPAADERVFTRLGAEFMRACSAGEPKPDQPPS